MKISYSSFNTFKTCPLQYKYSYIERLPTPERPELYFGSLIHKIVQYALKKDPILPSADELLEKLKIGWRADIFASDETAKQYFDFGTDMIKKFHANYKPGLRNIVAVEKYFRIPLGEKHILSGVIDRIDKLPFGAYEVIDYKTSKNLPGQNEVDVDKQLATYNLAVEAMYPEAKDIRLTLYFLKHNSLITTTRRPDEVEAIKTELIKTADEIENEKKFAPRLNPLCDWCSYNNICPAYKDRLENNNIADSQPEGREESLDELAQKYIEAQIVMSELEPKIHAHFDKEDIEKYAHKKGTLHRTKDKKLKVKKIS